MGREQAGGKRDLLSNLVSEHLKSNAIALVKDRRGSLVRDVGKPHRIDSLRQALEKSKNNLAAETAGAVMASDASSRLTTVSKWATRQGYCAYIQPGGSIRDKDSIAYCKEQGLAMVMTRHAAFRH